jgi:hypothetical protein
MSCVCVLTPLVVATWPAFSAAVVAAASSLGYTLLSGSAQSHVEEDSTRTLNLEMAQSEIVTDSIGRDQRIVVARGGVTVVFSRDARGKASICVSGTGHTDDALRALGEELSQRVIQKYVYQRLMEEMKARQFVIVEEETDENQAIRLKVRHWDN